MNLFELFASFHITGMDFVLSYYREGLQLIDIHTFKLKKNHISALVGSRTFSFKSVIVHLIY